MSRSIQIYAVGGYVIRNLKSITQGRGSYKAEFSHYKEVPAHITQKIIAERQAEKA